MRPSALPSAASRPDPANRRRRRLPPLGSGDDHRRHPDLAIVFRGTPKDDRGRRPPSLVAEVVSERGEDRDYVEKRQEYLIFGIREYWIIDPGCRQVTVLVRRDGPDGPDWEERVYRGDEVIVSELLPGFAGTVAELWADAELDEVGANGPQ